MQGLLYKEFIQNKQNLFYLFFSILALSSIVFTPDIFPSEENAEVSKEFHALLGAFVYVLDFFLLNSFQPNFFQCDENKKWSYFAVSSPKCVTGVVWTNYVFVFMITVINFILCYVIDIFSMSLTGDKTSMLLLYAICFFVHIFFSAIDIPFMLRFGTKAGILYRGILFLFVLLFIIIYALFGDLSIFGSVDNFYEKIINFTGGDTIPEILWLIIGIFMHGAVLLYYFSYKISCKCYLKGVECYDK